MTQAPIFRPSFGNRPDSIVGREAVLEQLDDCFGSYPGMRERALLITGQRGMGKTALLLAAADRASEMDFVTIRTTCGPAMLDNIIDGLQRAGSRFVDDKEPPVKGFSAGAMGFSLGLTFTDRVQHSYGFRTKLDMLCERLDAVGKGVAILVDEVRPDSSEMRQLATTYQELAGEGRNIAIVMAGLPSVISTMLEEATLTFLNRATKVRLGPVAKGAVRAYYASAFKRSNRPISTATLEAAATATEGFPYLLQLIGYYLVDLTAEGEHIEDATLDRALELSREDLDENVFEPMLRPLSPADIAFLQAMSVDDGPTHVRDLEGRLGVSQGHVQSYRKRLLDAGVIISPRRGVLEFVVPALADYLRRSQ